MGPLEETYIIDIYNVYGYPRDTRAKLAINCDIGIHRDTDDQTYLLQLKRALENMEQSFQPDIIYYNAGTDLLEGDPLGNLNISKQAVIERDEIVFRFALMRNIPIVMVTSGGYQANNARVIADSITNLFEKLELEQVALKNFSKSDLNVSQSKL
jgi:histone deacetylase 11